VAGKAGGEDGSGIQAREAGMATDGIMPIEMSVRSEEWSRTLWSMSLVVAEVMQLQRKA
jgi:hypothetical protein